MSRRWLRTNSHCVADNLFSCRRIALLDTCASLFRAATKKSAPFRLIYATGPTRSTTRE